MAVRKFKPVTAGTRHKIIGTFDEITTNVPEKSLLSVKKSSGGRNNSGKMTVRYIGGGHKRMYRNIDFKRTKDGVVATVKTIEYDPNRTARIALLVYADGVKSYIIAPNGLQVGQTVMSGAGVAPEVGNTLYLSEIPLGTVIHNIELYPGQGAAMARSAGSYAQLLAREGKFAIIKLPSGETRTARIALLVYADGVKSYIIAPNGLQVGQTVMSGAGVAPEVGNTLYLSEIPLGTVIHNIELYPGQGAAMARSAGSYAQLLAREGKFAIIKLPSGETRMVLVTCRATIGVVSNLDHNLESSGKAGRERWLGRRPRNRGVVMNPVDHPMGGGEGRASGGHPRSRKGLLAKGYKTRNPKKTTSKFIISKKK